MTRGVRGAHSPVFGFEQDVSAPSLHISRIEPPQAARLVEPHSHQHLELLYFEQSAGSHRLGADEWETQAGDLVLIAPGEVHQWDSNTRERRPDVWVIAFTPAALDPTRSDASLFRHVSDQLLFPFLRAAHGEISRLNVPPAERQGWSSLLRDFHREQTAQPRGYADAMRAYLTVCLVSVLRVAASSDRSALREQPLLAEVFGFIEARFQTPISLVDVARAMHRAPGYLTSVVRRLTGRTVLEWITERRLAEARRLLLDSDDSVERIAQRISYTDPTHFIRQFRRVHGVTPAAWRRGRRVDRPSASGAQKN